MTVAELVAHSGQHQDPRVAQVVARRERGETWSTIAADLGVTTERCRQLHRLGVAPRPPLVSEAKIQLLRAAGIVSVSDLVACGHKVGLVRGIGRKTVRVLERALQAHGLEW
jgi:hypothetical protein